MAIDFAIRHVMDYLSNHPLLLLSLVSASLCCILLYFASRLFHGQKKGENPFDKDHRRPPEPFEYDRKARRVIIRQKFEISKVPKDLDAIIIGSGMGGLTAGVLLTRAGKKCLVLEQHDKAGGCSHSYNKKGFEFDTGIHYIGNMHDGCIDRTLVDQLTCGQLRWAKMDDAFDTVALGQPGSIRKYPMKTGKDRYIQNLVDLFPEEEKAIRKYMDLVFKSASTIMGVIMLKVLPRKLVRFLVVTGLYRLVFSCYRKGYCQMTLQEVLDGITSNEELKAVLSYLWGDYGVIPKEAPFILHAIIIKHYINGAYYPMNGTSEMAYHMCQVIQKAGGQVLCLAHVAKILCDESGRAVSVQIAKTDEVIEAPVIISDAGVTNTFKHLLPQEVAQKSSIYQVINKVGPSHSFISTFIGIDGDSDDLKLPSGNVWYHGSSDVNNSMEEFMNLPVESLEDATIPLSFISFPSAKDPEWSNKYPGKSAALIITLAKWEWFKEWKDEKRRHRGERYEGIKNSIGKNLWRQCIELFPQLEGKMVYMNVGTPVTNQHYFLSPEGEMYGLSHDTNRFNIDAVTNLRPDTDIPGLYLTGQDTLTCGFTTALIMGLICSSQILNRNLYSDLRQFHKDLKVKGKLKPLTEKKNE